MRDGVITGRLTSSVDEMVGAELCFFLPAMLGLAPRVVDVLACLPISNVNAELIATLSSRPEKARAVDFGCVFAADPFYDSGRLSDDVLALGVDGIANMPSIGFLTGPFSDAMTASGFDFEREMHCLRTAKRRGLKTAAFVRSLPQGVHALDQEPDLIVVHPGRPVDREVASHRFAEEAARMISELKQHSTMDCPILLYRHPVIFKELGLAAEVADGVVLYGS
jgi:predicted TIM-barrel enzyme